MRRTYGYDAYRGRSKGRIFLTALAVILAVVLVLVVAFFLFAQRYVVYTDDGQAHLELPFFQRATPTPTPGPTQTQNIVIITAEPTPEPTSTPDPAVNAVWLLRGALTDGTARAQVEKAGGNAVVFNMKADDGTLGYVSDLPQAIAFGASDAKPGLNDAIRELTAGDLYTIARVSCFKDNKAPRGNNALAIKTNSGYNWRDSEELRWMNVAVPEAGEYVIGVCKELAALGFDEILLENSGYPTEGSLNNIKKGETYDPDDLAGPVGEFYTRLTSAMEESCPQVKISFSAGVGVLSGQGDLSGQTPFMLGSFAYRLYVPVPEKTGDYAAAIAVLKEAGFEESRLVYLTASGTGGEEGSTLVKPWETPAPTLTPRPSLPTASPSPSPEASPEVPEPSSAASEPFPEPSTAPADPDESALPAAVPSPSDEGLTELPEPSSTASEPFPEPSATPAGSLMPSPPADPTVQPDA